MSASDRPPIMLAVTPEAFVADHHALGPIRPHVAECLARLSPRFDGEPRCGSFRPVFASLL